MGPALPVLSEPLFRDTLCRECRRAERAGRAVGLLQVTWQRRDGNPRDAWAALVDAIAPVRQGTDVVGWLDHRETLGIILPADAVPHVAVENSPLFRTLQAEAVRGFSVQVGVSPGLCETKPRRYDAVKRLFDLVLSALLLIVLSPLMLAAAVLVKLTSRGPVLFTQPRVGQGRRPFVMLKFRTMEVNAAPAIHQEFVSAFITGRQAGGGTNAPMFKIVKDPRVTSVGHFLRRTSIDELPQLWNVLRGDMSLVGPRPPLPYEVAQYQTWHLRRIGEAKPGLTGLWQVNGRSRTTFDEMVRLDLRYVQTRSFWTDLRILLATPRAVISGKGAC